MESNTESSSPFVATSITEPCESTLESDPAYRFNYVAEVVGLSSSDFDILHRNREVTKPLLSSIVDRVYEKMFQFFPMKRHFLEQHHGFYGHAPESIEQLTLEHEQTKFRKMKLEEYFTKLSTAPPDDTFAILLDMIARIHTPHQGNQSLAIPIVQLAALLGFVNDQFTLEISKLDALSADQRTELQRAYSKLFWVQNNMFLRHYAK